MTDFLHHLVSRSTPDHSSPAILQPRLPSRFEAAPAVPETPEFSIESDVREILPRSTERERPAIPEQHAPASRQARVSENLQPVEAAPRWQSVTPAILPAPEAPSKANSLLQETPWVELSSGLRQPEHAGFLTQKAEADSPPRDVPAVSSKIITKLIREDTSVEREMHLTSEPIPARPGPKTVQILQPVLPVSYPVKTESSRTHQEPEPQQVVEVHIGRIEVRATPASNNPPAKPRSTSIMTLDEYLQRRKAGDRR